MVTPRYRGSEIRSTTNVVYSTLAKSRHGRIKTAPQHSYTGKAQLIVKTQKQITKLALRKVFTMHRKWGIYHDGCTTSYISMPPVSLATPPHEPLTYDCSWEYCMFSAYTDLSFDLEGICYAGLVRVLCILCDGTMIFPIMLESAGQYLSILSILSNLPVLVAGNCCTFTSLCKYP